MELWTTTEIARRTGFIKTRQIADLVKTGVIKPKHATQPKGSPRLYDKRNVFEIVVAVALRGFLSSKELRSVMKSIPKDIEEDGYGVLMMRQAGWEPEVFVDATSDMSPPYEFEFVPAGADTDYPKDWLHLRGERVGSAKRFVSLVLHYGHVKRFVDEKFG
jgi:hypothetical protein